MKLAIAIELLKIAIRTELLKMLGVDVIVERAFKEGWDMHGDSDPNLIIKTYYGRVVTISHALDLERIVENTRCWRSVDEAWANSDAQEMFE